MRNNSVAHLYEPAKTSAGGVACPGVASVSRLGNLIISDLERRSPK